MTGANGFTRINLKIDKVKSLNVAIPPKKEQEGIAHYLDRKTKAIDELIEDKKRLLSLYEEEKKAIIDELVTGKKVWNGKEWTQPDEVRESGIAWIGKIPKHWEIKKIKYCFQIIGSGSTPKSDNYSFYKNGKHNWLLTGDLRDNEIYETSKKITDNALSYYKSLFIYPENSLVIAMYGATIAKLGILKAPSTVNQACCVLCNSVGIDSLFAFYFLLSARKDIINLSHGGTQPNISKEDIRNYKINVPDLYEQNKISLKIEKEDKRINKKIKTTKRLIELLNEYKQSLISEVVTGKVKVVDQVQEHST